MNKKIIISRKGPMCFGTLEEFNSKKELVFFPKIFEKYSDLPLHEIVVIEGKEENDKIFVESFYLFQDYLKAKIRGVKLYLHKEDSFEELKKLLLSHKGLVKTHLILERPQGKYKLSLDASYDIFPSQELNQRLKSFGRVEYF